MKSNEMKDFIQEAFFDVIEDMNATEETYAKYFSKDYIQHVDGRKLTYADFVAHMKSQKAVMDFAKITFKHMLVEDDKVATVHLINGIKKDGGIVEAQVNAFIQVRDNKIILCDELTHILRGEESDKDLGSRY